LIESGGAGDAPGDSDLFDVVGEMIHKLDSADPQGMSFRYPVGTAKSGRKPLLSEDFEYFDMVAFRDQAKRLSNFIDGCSSQFSVYLDFKHEMERDLVP
jgi:hypothetical protein